MTRDQPSHAPIAVILVAGVGERLRPLTDDRPKALLDIGGETILARAVRLLVRHGVSEIVLATGYCEDAVRAAMATAPVPVRFCFNPEYATTQNAMSLLACREAVAGRTFYKIDGDLVFQRDVLDRLDRSGASLAVAVDTKVTLGEEEMKVQWRAGGRITAFGKRLDPSTCAGESIGLERIDGVAVSQLFLALQKARDLEETNLYYEDIYSRMIEGGLVAEGVDVAQVPWMEVDTPQDLARAREMIRSGRL